MGLLVLYKNMLPTKLSYNKEEKLKSRKLINHLFDHGKQIQAFPLKMLYDFVEESPQHLQAGVTISSRNFKKAVDRNRAKRVIRECYRLQKTSLQFILKEKGLALSLFFIYTHKEMPDYVLVKEKMHLLLQKLEEMIKNLTPQQ